MAKKQPKPLFSLRHDFEASLENVCGEVIMLLQAVETVLQYDDKLPAGVQALLAERAAATRAALMSEP
jgi:hypothetical protein